MKETIRPGIIIKFRGWGDTTTQATYGDPSTWMLEETVLV